MNRAARTVAPEAAGHRQQTTGQVVAPTGGSQGIAGPAGGPNGAQNGAIQIGTIPDHLLPYFVGTGVRFVGNAGITIGPAGEVFDNNQVSTISGLTRP